MNDMVVRPKSEYHEKMRRDMEKFLRGPDWTPAQRVALACRILDADGHESALAGQVTLRGEKLGTYWGLSFGLGFDEARANNILLFDNDLNVLEGEGMANPANRFHLWIYKDRPKVNSIVHTHAPHTSALSMVAEPLMSYCQIWCTRVDQAAILLDASARRFECSRTSIPSWNFTPLITLASHSNPRSARQRRCAVIPSL